MMSTIGDILSIGFIVALILLSSTFSIALLNEHKRRTFKTISAIILAVAVGFMLMFIIGFVFFPEPI